MTTDSGGWTLVAYTDGSNFTGWGTATGDLNSLTNYNKAGTFKFADSVINTIGITTAFRTNILTVYPQILYWKPFTYAHTSFTNPNAQTSYTSLAWANPVSYTSNCGTYSMGGLVDLNTCDPPNWVSDRCRFIMNGGALLGTQTYCGNNTANTEVVCSMELWIK